VNKGREKRVFDFYLCAVNFFLKFFFSLYEEVEEKVVVEVKKNIPRYTRARFNAQN